MRIEVDDLTGPAIAVFLAAHVEELRSVSPPCSSHALDLDGLRDPRVTFWTVTDGEAVVGCGALKDLGGGHSEVKSMRTAPGHTRRGVASTLLRHLLAEARRAGFERLSLETGSGDFFAPALRLYARHGFTVCPPFGDYAHDPHSVFMTRPL